MTRRPRRYAVRSARCAAASRGRDLLKKRLTRRGYAPTAAIMDTGPTLPVRLLTKTMPPSLVSATVKMVLGSGSAKTIPAGATASVLALTQGVLTTMKLAQLKWIGLSLLATSLSVGGAVAVSHRSAGTSPVEVNASLATAGVAHLPESPELQTRGAASPRILKGWGEAIDPDGDCSIHLADGRLTIKVPAPMRRKGHGLEAERNTLNAPRVLRDIEGDFIADLKVDGTFKPVGKRQLPYPTPSRSSGRGFCSGVTRPTTSGLNALRSSATITHPVHPL